MFDNSLSVLLNKGDGTFAAAKNYPVGINPIGTALQDFNNDGVLDIAVGNGGPNTGPGSISILIGKGDGTYYPKEDLFTGSKPYFGTSTDLDDDGNNDLILTNQNSNQVSIFLGNGDGTFASPNFVFTAPNSHNEDILFGDFNNNGYPDIAVASNLENVFLNSMSTPSLTLTNMDIMISKLLEARANIGATVSKLTSAIDNLTMQQTNTSAARSRIEDTDYAAATTALSKAQIVQQASMAMLAQANQMPQMVLQLIKASF